MEVRELEAFVAVSEELNFRKAADRLGMTQPPLTRLISQMEYRLGVKLFTRSTRSVELTGAGVFLFEKSKSLLNEMKRIEQEVKTLSGIKRDRLTISLTGNALHSIVPRLIASFREQFPQIKIELLETKAEQVSKKLKDDAVDIAFGIVDYKDPKIQQYKIQSHKLGVLVPLGNSLASRKKIKLTDLKDQTLIFHGKHEKLGFQSEFNDYLKSKNIHCKIYYKKKNESCGNLTVLGRGLLITSMNHAHAHSGAKFVSFDEFHKEIRLYGSWSPENKSLSLKAFVSFLKENSSAPSSHMDQHLA